MQPQAIDVVHLDVRRVPRDHRGRPVRLNGATLIRQALAACCPASNPKVAELYTDAYRRWRVGGRHASVAHVGASGLVALHPLAPIGVDLLADRPRPLALAWLGDLVGQGEPATIIQFTECEALIKASPLTKGTFRGVRLPPARAGWRHLHQDYWVTSGRLEDGGAYAIATSVPMRLQWHAATVSAA